MAFVRALVSPIERGGKPRSARFGPSWTLEGAAYPAMVPAWFFLLCPMAAFVAHFYLRTIAVAGEEMSAWKEQGSERHTEQQRKMLNAEIAREFLMYEPLTGKLIWKRNMSTRARAGDEAGVIQCGKYRRIGFRGKYYLAHRLAWLIHTGSWPKHEIDHINGNKSDNRICNLREANCEQNRRNTLHKNSSGVVGASYVGRKNKYRALIRVGGKRIYLGLFDTAEDAGAAYMRASKELHGEFSPCRS